MTISRTGVVRLERIAVGSKTEREAVVLVDGERHWELRRPGAGLSAVPDPELAALAGRRVTVTGYAGSGVLVVNEIAEIPENG